MEPIHLNSGNSGTKRVGRLSQSLQNAGRVASMVAMLAVSNARAEDPDNAVAPSLAVAPTALVVPGAGESLSEAPTNEEIIALLQDNRTALSAKYPSLGDEPTWLKIVGSVATGSIKPEQLNYLTAAFDEGPQRTMLTSFGKEIAKPKSVVAEGKIPLNETKEERAKRELLEKTKELREGIADNITTEFFKDNNWRITIKNTASYKIKRDSIETEFTSNDPDVKRAELYFVSPIIKGSYEFDVDFSGSGIIGFWMYDNFDKPIIINGADRTFFRKGINNIIIPDGVSSIKFFLSTSPSMTSIEVTKFGVKSK